MSSTDAAAFVRRKNVAVRKAALLVTVLLVVGGRVLAAEIHPDVEKLFNSMVIIDGQLSWTAPSPR